MTEAHAIVLWKDIIDSGWSLWIGPDVNGGWAAQLKPYHANLHEWIKADSLVELIQLCWQHVNYR